VAKINRIATFHGYQRQQHHEVVIHCQQIAICYAHEQDKETKQIGLMVGRLASEQAHAGDQSCKTGSDDFVGISSHFAIERGNSRRMLGMIDFKNRNGSELEQLLQKSSTGTMGYFKSLNCEGKNEAAQATHLFWQLCERRFQDLVYACADESNEETKPYAKLSHILQVPPTTAIAQMIPHGTRRMGKKLT
jgi:hypothetical protein